MNLVEAKLVRDQGPALVFADHKVPLPDQLVAARQGLDGYFDKPLIVGLRPSSLEDAAFASQDWPRIKGEVAVTEELGSEVNVIFHMAAPQVHHDVMIARFDKAAKDEVEAEELAGEGQSAVDRPGQPQDLRQGRPLGGPGHRHLRVPLLRRRHRHGHRPRHRRRRRTRTTRSQDRPGVSRGRPTTLSPS